MEGSYLSIQGKQGRYEITIQDLDAARIYDGAGIDNRIVFERDGRQETIRATHGAETGMKWLSEKANCLTIRFGEGYCRD